MPRARNIKYSFFTNELLGSYDPLVSLLFVGLWCLADRNGILENRPLRIKAEIFPYREGVDIGAALDILEAGDFLQRYQVDGKNFIFINNFNKHQTPHHTEKSKGLPFPPSFNGYLTVKPRVDDHKTTVAPPPDLLKPEINNNNNNAHGVNPAGVSTIPHKLPLDWEPGEKLKETTLDHFIEVGLAENNIAAFLLYEFELKKFRAYNTKKTILMEDWAAVWLSWVYKVQEKAAVKNKSLARPRETVSDFIARHTNRDWAKGL